MLENRIEEYGVFPVLGPSFRQEVAAYIEQRHLEDGGYFFARVLPSCGGDTYFAVKSLAILGMEAARPADIAGFFFEQVEAGELASVPGLFYAAEVLNGLGRITGEFKDYARPRIEAFRNKAGGFGAYKRVDVAVTSELENTCRAVRVLGIIGADYDRDKVKRFTGMFLRPDGGYGGKGYSTLPSTFYATEIYKLLGVGMEKPEATKAYLRKMEDIWRLAYLENVYWLVAALANLGERTARPQDATEFVMMCQRSNGGFARATVMGIPTLEYTFYALSILKETGALGEQVRQ